MKVLTDTEKAHAYLTGAELDIRRFLEDSDGIHALEYFEDVHIAIVEAMNLLGIELDTPPDDEFDDELLADYEDKQHAAELENFDPITILEKQEQTGELK